MVEGGGESAGRSVPAERLELEKKLEGWGWGLFFVWVGIAFLTDLGWGLGLLGVSVITLGVQLFRVNGGLKAEGFWVVAGLLFLVGGLWEMLLESEFPMVPILLVVIGVALIWSTVGGKRPPRHPDAYRGPHQKAT